MSVLRFHSSIDTRQKPTRMSWRQRFLLWWHTPPKAPVFKFKNPTHLKLERARRNARKSA